MEKVILLKVPQLIEWQIRNGLKAYEAADALGIGKHHYSRIVNGAVPIGEQFTLRFMALTGWRPGRGRV